MSGLLDVLADGEAQYRGGLLGGPVGAGRGLISPPITPGNIDLTNRPIVKNKDGSISTVRSMSVSFGGPEVLIPMVSDDGKMLSEQQAVTQYLKTGKHLGMFANAPSATEYAQALHTDQERLYGGRK